MRHVTAGQVIIDMFHDQYAELLSRILQLFSGRKADRIKTIQISNTSFKNVSRHSNKRFFSTVANKASNLNIM